MTQSSHVLKQTQAFLGFSKSSRGLGKAGHHWGIERLPTTGTVVCVWWGGGVLPSQDPLPTPQRYVHSAPDYRTWPGAAT